MQLTQKVAIFALLAGLTAPAAHAATIPLGAFNFDSSLFGNTLLESDGGTFRNSNWLNIVNANPGNPGALTGANFDTGIANIGLGGIARRRRLGTTQASLMELAPTLESW